MRAFKLSLRRAEKHLAAVDSKLAQVIARHGPCTLNPAWDRSPYESLVRAVAHQQLHGRAAEAILGRLIAKFPRRKFPRPEDILATPLEEMRSHGFSLPKVTAIRGIAEGALSGVVLARSAAEKLSDEELIVRLSALRGIGRWTVEMLLIFTLGRLDVMPIDDFGVRTGLQEVYRLRGKIGQEHFARRTAAWAPFRSVGAWYLWREADRLKQSPRQRATG